MSRPIGIDLGTTNSLVAFIDELGNPKVIKDKDTGPLVRSVVSFTPEGINAVGEEAIEISEKDPSKVVYSVKRLMGVAPKDVGQDLSRFPQKAAEDQRVVRLSIEGKEYSAPEISSAILKRLKTIAEGYLKEPISQVVITVPAYFDDAQRQATKDAARLAGLEAIGLLNEPTAAALAYGLNAKRHGVFAVYDLGGGTFDLSILRLERNNETGESTFEVVATAGDTHLGGDDFDMRIAEKVLARRGVSLDNATDRFKARRAGERTKILLTEAEKAPFSVTLLDGRTIEDQVSRGEFQGWVQDLLARTGACCKRALADAKLTPIEISEVILVGGSTRMLSVRSYVKEVFGKEPRTDVDPDQAVALGAAIRANIILGGQQDVLLLDVNPLSLGIETMGGVVASLIPRNSTIPTTAKNTFTTHVDGQTSVEIHVLQGERDLARDCRSLARFKLAGIPPVPAGIPRIEVTFQLDADGILQVSAMEERSGVEAKIEVRPSYGLSEDEIISMIEVSLDNAETDVAARFLIEARVEAEAIIRATQKALDEDSDLLSAEEKAQVEKALQDVKTTSERTDVDQIRGAISALDTATQEFAQRRMNRAIQIALAGKDISELGGTLELTIPVPPKK